MYFLNFSTFKNTYLYLSFSGYTRIWNVDIKVQEESN